MTKKNMNFVAIIPARTGSKKIKNKNIIKINKHPLVSYSIEAAKRSKYISDIFVSTDGKNVANVARRYGAKVIFRPKKTKDDDQIEPSVLYSINYIEKVYKKKIKNIVLLQPTSPLRRHDDLDKAIKSFIKKKADSLFSCVNLHSTIWIHKYLKLLPLGHNPFNRKNRNYMPETLTENGSIYITKKKIYKKFKNRLGGKITSYIMDLFSVFELDEKKDINFFSILAGLKNKKRFKLLTPKKVL